jgi:hypothetical protein
MNVVRGSTSNETKMIKGIQAAVGALQDGLIGEQTMSDIACLLKADCFPLTLKIYGAPVIIAKTITPIHAPNKPLRAFPNSISGSFYVRQAVGGNVPVSICISGGVPYRLYSCHANEGLPESVLYRQVNGTMGIKRARFIGELPDNIMWAVGGMGLLDMYDPKAEGFTGVYADVLRRTNHSMLGIKNGYVYMVYCPNMTGQEVNAFAKKLGLEKAIMLDGGHIAAINGAEGFAKINTAVSQAYVIQAG